MQGHLWSETQRETSQLEDMVYPRLLMLAERAWHRAAWEAMENVEPALSDDWRDMANTLGYKELMRLDRLYISYHVPPPGARYVNYLLPFAATLCQVRRLSSAMCRHPVPSTSIISYYVPSLGATCVNYLLQFAST